MKNLLILCLLVSTIGFSQQGINYKAIIQDGDQIVANTPIVLYFTVKENGTTDVYKETRVITTNANGMVVTNIGEGTPTLGSFDTIDWTKEQYLNVGVNIGSGLVDLGTTAFQNVPYALYAKTSGDKVFSTVNNVTSNSNGDIDNDNFVFGATQLDGSSVSRMFFNKNKGAFRAGHVNGSTFFTDVWDDTNVGTYSFATGLNTKASGYASTALGSHSSATGWESTALGNGSASGDFSAAIGYGARAIEDFAIALGYNAEANGERSVAIGFSTAESFLETSLGINNTEVSGSPDTFVATDRLFVIGNGTSNSHKSDALVMLKNGNTELNGTFTIDPSNNETGYTLPTTKGTSGQVLTVGSDNSETSWSFVSGSGHLERITEGGNTGYRLLGAHPEDYGPIGNNAIDFSNDFDSRNDSNGATGDDAVAFGVSTLASGVNATAFGYATWATGDYSTVFGYESEATGDESTAFGQNTLASGYASFSTGNQTEAIGDYSSTFGQFSKTEGDGAVAFGYETEAKGFKSAAFGEGTVASGDISSTFGVGTIAESYGQTSVGLYNTEVTANRVKEIDEDDRLFVIGNGTGNSNRSDALVMLKNGDTKINGALEVEEIQAADSGDADMKAYIYGLVSSAGTKSVASSGGFTVQKIAIGTYRLNFINPPSSSSSYIAVASLTNIGFIRTVRSQNYLTVSTYNTSGILSDQEFSFVVYKK
ncbi:hypothetical protein N1F78_10910 [Seonamhaeicola sp. MEBiC1930]|uniref:hypothetical protein n=1 Tax=Seonamhaeicola sp. MEBiC01930 TaxID=2976768 RepID=UPI00324E9C6A